MQVKYKTSSFSILLGDIEDYPGLDSIPKYEIEVADGSVKVRAKKDLLATEKRSKTMTSRDPDNPTTFVIVGGGKF